MSRNSDQHQIATAARGIALLLRPCAVWFTLTIAAALPTPGKAQEVEPTTFYRRIFVPAEHVESWPRDGQKYLPIEASDFEESVNAANVKAENPALLPTIESAHYWARLDGDRLTDCRGEWRITASDPDAFLPLKMAIAIRDARWQGVTGEAMIGRWGASAGIPEVPGLAVPKSGTLEFAWSAQSRAIQNGIELTWQVPNANATQLTLDLPVGKKPHIDGGVIESNDSKSIAPEPKGESTRRWEIALPPSASKLLRIVDADDAATAPAPLLTLREILHYRVAQRGVDIDAEFTLDASIDSPQELTFNLPTGVRLLSAQVGDLVLTWRTERSAGSSEEIAVIELRDLLRKGPLRVVLRAWQPLTLNEPWQLPKLRPEGVHWQSGSIELSIVEPLELEAIALKDGVQIGVEKRVSEGESIARLAMYSPAAEVTARISPRLPQATIRLGTTLSLADTDINGHQVSEWTVSAGSVHRLMGQIRPGWIIDAVETSPPEALNEWFVDEREGQRRLEIQLARPVQPGRSVLITLTGRLLRERMSEPLSDDSIQVIRWEHGSVVQHLLSFQTSAPYTVEASSDLTRLSPSAVSLADAQRFKLALEESHVFDLARTGKSIQLMLSPERAQYQADVLVDATFQLGKVEQNYHITLRPESSGLDRVLIYCTQPLREEVQWSIKSSGVPLVAERVVDHSVVETLRDPKLTGEAWLIRLPRYTNHAVELVGQTTTDWPQRKPLSLLALPEALSQQGRVVVRATLDESPIVQPRNMQWSAIPSDSREPMAGVKTTRARIAYRYDPNACLTPTRSPELWLGFGAKSRDQLLTIRNLNVESFYWPDGRGVHQADYELENNGATTFYTRFSNEEQVRAVLRDGQPLEISEIDVDGLLTIPLTPGNKRSILTFHFESRDNPLRAGASIRQPVLHEDLRVLAGNWLVWLPTEFSVTTPVGYSERSAVDHWRRRLFGMFGRPYHAAPFYPLRSADWTSMFNPFGDRQPDSLGADSGFLGWNAYSTSFVAEPPLAIILEHPPVTTAWALAIFLICLVSGRWIPTATSRIACTTSAALLAMLLPIAFAPIATGAFLGLVLSTFSLRPRREGAQFDTSRSWSRYSTVAMPIVTFLICATTIKPCGAAMGTEPATHSAAKSIERVLVPVGPSGELVGSKVYVSESFLQRLLQADRQRNDTPRDWLLHNATYSGELREGEESSETVAGDWTLVFDIEVFARDTVAVLPLVRSEAAWQPVAMLDGVPIRMDWRNDEKRCAIAIAEPGRYALTIAGRPKIVSSNRRNRIALTIPPFAGAKLMLKHPKNVVGLIAAGVESGSIAGSEPGLLKLELDAVQSLEIQWSATASPSGTAQNLRVTGLRWLHISSKTVELQSKYIFEGNARRPEFVVVAFDPRWELMTEGESTAVILEEQPDGRRAVNMPLPSDDLDRQEVTLRWRMANDGIFGRLRLPPIELLSIPVTHRWVALSAEPELECEILESAGSAVTTNEFLAMWGTTNASPQTVLGNFRTSVPWSVAIRPRQRESTISELLHFAAGRQRLRIAYQADVSPGLAHQFQFELSVPADVAVDEIAIVDSGGSVPIRWSRVGKDRLNVFFGRRLAADYRLTLHTSAPAEHGTEISLPRIAAVATTAGSQDVYMHREESVLVELRGVEPSHQLAEGTRDFPPASWPVRRVGAYRLDKKAFEQARLKITDNNLEITGPSVLSLHRDAEVWIAALTAELHVLQGQLDVLRLTTPPAWAGPFSIDCDAAAAMELDSTDPKQPLLLIRFSESIHSGESVRLSVRGPLRQVSQSTVAVPHIEPDQAFKGPRLVTVPASLDNKPVAWQENGVRPLEGPPLVQIPASFANGDTRWLEVVGTEFEVTLRPTDSFQPATRIRLADTRVWISAMGARLLESQFTIAAPDLTECVLKLPPGQTLVSIQLAGVPAIAHPVDEQTWDLTLGATALPRVLEVVSVETSNRSAEVRRPALFSNDLAIPVELSLWSVGHAIAVRPLGLGGGAPATEAELVATRFDRLVSIAETATQLAMESPPPDGYRWFRPWAERLHTMRGEVAQIIAGAAGSGRARVSTPADEQLAGAAARLDLWFEQCNKLLGWPRSEQEIQTQESVITSLDASTESSQWVYCIVEGGAESLTIDSGPFPVATWQTLVIGPLTILVIAAASMWLVRRSTITDFFYRWPHAIVCLVGIGYWAWLWPSWLGLVVVALSVIMAWRVGWPGRSLPMERSTVIRLPRADMVAPQ